MGLKKHSYLLIILTINLAFPQAYATDKLCKKLFAEPTSLIMSSTNISDILTHPLKYLNTLIRVPAKQHRAAGPFRIVVKSDKSPLFQQVMRNIEILSREEKAREEVFGGTRYGREYVRDASKELLDLRGRQYWEDPFVEVGATIFYLNTGEVYVSYYTSNHRAGISLPYENYAVQIERINLGKRKVVAIDSMHTHPVNLLPSRTDRDGYRLEMALTLRKFSHIKVENWHMHTVMESEPVIHSVKLKDWWQGSTARK